MIEYFIHWFSGPQRLAYVHQPSLEVALHQMALQRSWGCDVRLEARVVDDAV